MQQFPHAFMTNFTAHILFQCDILGFSKLVLEVLTEVFEQYLVLIAERCNRFSRHCGRNQVNIFDVSEAFQLLGISAPVLDEFIKAGWVTSSPSSSSSSFSSNQTLLTLHPSKNLPCPYQTQLQQHLFGNKMESDSWSKTCLSKLSIFADPSTNMEEFCKTAVLVSSDVFRNNFFVHPEDDLFILNTSDLNHEKNIIPHDLNGDSDLSSISLCRSIINSIVDNCFQQEKKSFLLTESIIPASETLPLDSLIPHSTASPTHTNDTSCDLRTHFPTISYFETTPHVPSHLPSFPTLSSSCCPKEDPYFSSDSVAEDLSQKPPKSIAVWTREPVSDTVLPSFVKLAPFKRKLLDRDTILALHRKKPLIPSHLPKRLSSTNSSATGSPLLPLKKKKSSTNLEQVLYHVKSNSYPETETKHKTYLDRDFLTAFTLLQKKSHFSTSSDTLFNSPSTSLEDLLF